ncbi:unnamed protein product [Effrenium voratum]|nr:unnamed protein product [Effrenium voratum]
MREASTCKLSENGRLMNGLNRQEPWRLSELLGNGRQLPRPPASQLPSLPRLPRLRKPAENHQLPSRQRPQRQPAASASIPIPSVSRYLKRLQGRRGQRPEKGAAPLVIKHFPTELRSKRFDRVSHTGITMTPNFLSASSCTLS